MNKELEQLKLQRKRAWKKFLNCSRGWNKIAKNYLSKKSPVRLQKLETKRIKYDICLETYLIANQRIKDLENV